MVNFNKTIIFQGLRGSNTFPALGFYFFQGVGPIAYLDFVIFQGYGLDPLPLPLWIRACAEYLDLSFTSMVKRLCMLALAFADFLCYLYQNVILRLLCFCYNEVDFSYPQSQRFSDIKGVAGNCHHSSCTFL